MSILLRRPLAFTFAAIVALVGGVLAARLLASRDAPRDVRVVIRAMTYYVEGVEGANPALPLVPGGRVRVTLRNEDKGMVHDFTIPEWKVRTEFVTFGREASVAFTVPDDEPASVSYVCTPHSAMMSGRIVLAQ